MRDLELYRAIPGDSIGAPSAVVADAIPAGVPGAKARVRVDGETAPSVYNLSMNSEEFLEGFGEVVGEPGSSLTLETRLDSLPGWDSVAYLGVTVMIEERMGVTISPDALIDAVTIGDLLAAAQGRKG